MPTSGSWKGNGTHSEVTGVGSMYFILDLTDAAPNKKAEAKGIFAGGVEGERKGANAGSSPLCILGPSVC